MLTTIIIGLLVAWLCAVMAKSRGRSAFLWFILGFVFNIITVLVLLLIGSKR